MIICKKCNKVLEEGPGETIEKICMKCVRGEAPAADLTKIMTPQGVIPKMSLKDYKRFYKKFTSMSVEHTYLEINDEFRLGLQIKDAHGKEFMSMAFTRQQLLDFVSDIMALEEKKNNKREFTT